MECVDLPIDQVDPDENQPRRQFDRAALEALAADLKQRGQIEPIIVYRLRVRYVIVNGERRYRALQIAGIVIVKCIVLEQAPSPSEQLTLQLVIDCHRADLTAYERFEAYSRLMELEKLSGTELAKRLSISKQSVTRVLSLGDCSEEVRQLVKEGKIGSAAAYAVARMSAQNRDIALESIANGTASRDKLERLANSNQKKERRVSRVCCELPHCSVSLRGKEPMSLDGLIEVFETLIRSVRKAKKEGYDTATFARVLRLKADQAAHPSAADQTSVAVTNVSN